MAERKRLGARQLALVTLATAASVALCFVVVPRMDTDTALAYSIAGYVLTPFVAAGALIWARSRDLRLQGDPAYLRLDGRRRVRLIGLIAILSFIPGLVHIWYIAGFIGSWLS